MQEELFIGTVKENVMMFEMKGSPLKFKKNNIWKTRITLFVQRNIQESIFCQNNDYTAIFVIIEIIHSI